MARSNIFAIRYEVVRNDSMDNAVTLLFLLSINMYYIDVYECPGIS